jgi:heme exporter protein A
VSDAASLFSADILLRFEAVALRRGGRLLFENLDLTVKAGERLQLTGRNGSGKSSLLRLAANLLRQECGRIERAPLALADDHLAFDREQPLIATLSFWTGLGGSDERLEFALKTLDLAGLAPVPVRLLSAGQLKRATLARVAGTGAPLWLLDEPLNALDRSGSESLATLLDWHTAQGGAVVAASHLVLPGDWQQLEVGR